MEGHTRSLSDVDEPATRRPVFTSQRFDRPGDANPGARGGSAYTADELIGKMLNRAPSERHSSHRYSSASDTVLRELALAEASFNPTDLLQEGLDEWHDRSLSMQLMKRSQSITASRKRNYYPRNSGVNASGRSAQVFPSQTRLDELPVSQQLVPEANRGTRHRYDHDFGHLGLSTTNEDGSALDIPKEYASTLNSAPQSTLIHLVLLYHQALVKNGLKDEAANIAHHLSELELADMAELVADLSGIDLLLRDGLLKYLMSIQPFIPSIPSQVVKFKDVVYTGTVQLDAGYESMYTKALGTVKGPFKKSTHEKVTLLRDFTGYLMPGTLTLIMGTPGSGVQQVNSILAGRAKRPGSSSEGSVTYNGRNVHGIKARRFTALVGPNDLHFAGLTVRETLEFARECSQYYKAGHYGAEMKEIVGEALKAGQDPKLETNLSMMGLKRVAERPVGSPVMPSITEAERHRLSVAEMIAGTYAVYLFDQLNRGLDDSVTFDLITSIRIFTRVRSTTVAASLIQPAQDVFDLFDRIILLDSGHIVYQGPRHDVLPYFESLGYVKPRQLSVPEFLEEVTTSDGAQYLEPGYPGLNIEGFVAAYKNSDHYKDTCRIVDTPEIVEEIWVQGSHPLGVTMVQSHPNKGQGIVEPLTTLVASINEKGGSLVDVCMTHTGTVHAGDEVVAVGGATGMLNYVKVGNSDKEDISQLDQPQEFVRLQLERPLPDERAYEPQFSQDYVQDPWPEFLLLLNRDLKAVWRNKLSLIIRAIQVLVLGFYVGFIFFQVHPDAQQLNMNLLRSVFFVSLLDMTLFNLGQLPGLVEERQVFYKQSAANFYRPSSYMAAKIVGSMPASLAEATTWSIVVYFLTNLTLTDGGWHFWIFYVLIVLSVLNGAAMVRFFAIAAPDLTAATGMMGIVVAIFIVFAGFLMPRFEVPHYWIWAYYLDPLQWGITGLMVNEFTSSRYNILCKDIDQVTLAVNLPQCVNRPDQKIGHAYLAKGQFYTGQHWIGIAMACIAGWFALWTVLSFLAISTIRHVPLPIITPSAEARILRKTKSLIDRDLEGQGVKLSLNPVPVTLSWHELSYDVIIPGVAKTLPLLTYISGWAEPGEMIGILGATGSGKTVLLNCLAGRGVQSARLGGQILVNGFPRNENAFARVTGYVDRLEAYSPYMTVKEAVVFSCEIMLGKTTTLEQRKQFVHEIGELMELKTFVNTLVKSLGQSALTTAESTRLRIATELARNPSILFTDSPTISLDSRSALHMIKILKKIADSGRIVIVAMPMPSQRLVTCFTAVQILKRGGETVYWGPVGKDGALIKEYFEAIPGTPMCPANTSVATFAVDVIGDGVQDRKALKDYAFEYRVNELALHNHIQLQGLRRSGGSLGPEINDRGFGSSYSTRAVQIFKKLQLFYWRNVAYSWGRLFSSIIMAILLGSIFFQQDWNTTPGMNTKASAIFISTLLQTITNAQSVLPQVMVNRPNFERDKSARQFNLFLYTMSWTFGEIPYLAVSTLVYAAIFCGMSDIAYGSASDFFRYWFLLFEITLAITFLGMFLAAASLLPQIAGTLVTIFVGFWVATSGVVIPRRKVTPPFIWIFFSNPLQYALNAMTSLVFYCDVNSPECLNNGQNIPCLSSAVECPSCRCQRLLDTKKFVWSTIKFNRTLDHGNIQYNMLILLGFIILFRLATFVVWKYRTSKR